MKYVALLRGINVGGKGLIKMSELKAAIETAGFDDVSTYINSGNVFFGSDETSEKKLAAKIEQVIESTFGLPVRVLVISKPHMQRIIEQMPQPWGEREGWKYNTLFLLPPVDVRATMTAIGTPKPDIEIVAGGDGVIYQAVEFKSFGRSTYGKLAANPTYKNMTIRNLNTTRKLLELMS